MAELVASISHIWDFGNPRVIVVFYCVILYKNIDKEW